jgi:hypothetical protein
MADTGAHLASESDDSETAQSSDDDDNNDDNNSDDGNDYHDEDDARVEEEEAEAAAVDAPEVAAQAQHEWRVHPARKLLKEAFLNGDIPLDYNRQGSLNHHLKPRMIFDRYKNTPAFAGMPSGKQFTQRLNSLRKIVEKKNQRVEDDMDAFEIFRKNFPTKPHNHRGELRWEGSEAQALLKEDIEEGRHLEFHRPKLFWLSRPEFQQFTRKVFLGHIDQEKRLRKLNTFLKRKKDEGKGGSSSNSSND